MTRTQREQLSSSERFNILSRDDFTCQFCDARPGNDRLHVDHLLPVSLGGTNAPVILVTSCDRCNTGKGARVIIPKRLLANPLPDKAGCLIWKRFGVWNLELAGADDQYPSGLILNHVPKSWGSGSYWFNIERCGTEQSRVDWFEHIELKNWATSEVLTGLSEAFDFVELIYRPVLKVVR